MLQMFAIVFALAIFAGAVAFAIYAFRSGHNAPGNNAVPESTNRPGFYPYQRQPSLLTPAERSFFGVLQQALGSQYPIFAKVNMADILEPQPDLTNSQKSAARSRISQKHVDFVVCDPGDLSVQLAIELDDASHSRRDRQQADLVKDRAFASAGLRLLRFPAQQAYNVDYIRRQVFANHQQARAGGRRGGCQINNGLLRDMKHDHGN